MPPNVHIHIDELIVEGLDRQQAGIFSAEWQEALREEVLRTGTEAFGTRAVTTPALELVTVMPTRGAGGIRAADGARALVASIAGNQPGRTR